MGLSEFLYQKDTRYMCFLSFKGKVLKERWKREECISSHLWKVNFPVFFSLVLSFFSFNFYTHCSIITLSFSKELTRLWLFGMVKYSSYCNCPFSGSKHCSFLKTIGDDKLLPMVLAVPLRSNVIVLNFLCHRIWEPLCWEKWSLANWIKERR